MEEAGRITRAAGVVGIFTLLSRVTGLLRDVVVAYLFGARGAADAFFVAFRLPNMLRRLTAEGALTVAFIPVFTDYLTNHGADEAKRVARIIFTFATLFLGGLTLFGIFFAGPLTQLIAPGYLAEKFTLTVSLTRLMFPYILLVSLVALAMGILNSFRHFMAPAVSPALLNLSIIICAFVLLPFLEKPVVGLAFGVLLGGTAQLLLQLPFLVRHGVSPAFDFNFGHPALRRMLFLMGPAVFGAAVYQINVFVTTILASMLPEGSVAYLYYADRLLQFPLGVFAVSLGTAALPSFASMVAKKEFGELKAGLLYSLRLVNFISLPAALGLMVISVPVFSLFFQRGVFGADATVNTAHALVYFSFGLWGVSGIKVTAPVFYAMEDTRTPVWVAFWSFILNLILSFVLMGEVTASRDSNVVARAVVAVSQHLSLFSLLHGGLALATSISATFNFLVLLLILNRRLGQFPLREFSLSFFRNVLNALLMALPLFFIVRKFDWIGSSRDLLTHGAVFLLLLILGTLLYFALTFLLRSPEWPIMRELALRIKMWAFNKRFLTS
ncbi:MAG: murein biosynthesis integral membrane protein MurJ [Candidatus Binatia bacterium]